MRSWNVASGNISFPLALPDPHTPTPYPHPILSCQSVNMQPCRIISPKFHIWLFIFLWLSCSQRCRDVIPGPYLVCGSPVRNIWRVAPSPSFPHWTPTTRRWTSFLVEGLMHKWKIVLHDFWLYWCVQRNVDRNIKLRWLPFLSFLRCCC